MAAERPEPPTPSSPTPESPSAEPPDPVRAGKGRWPGARDTGPRAGGVAADSPAGGGISRQEGAPAGGSRRPSEACRVFCGGAAGVAVATGTSRRPGHLGFKRSGRAPRGEGGGRLPRGPGGRRDLPAPGLELHLHSHGSTPPGRAESQPPLPSQVAEAALGRPATPPGRGSLIQIQAVRVADSARAPGPPPPGSFHCAVCPAAFRLVAELLFHEHGHLAGAERGRGPGRCHVCGLRCPGPASLRAHYGLHTGERPHRRPRCPRAFRALAPRLRPQRRPPERDPGAAAEAGKPFACRFCAKPFRRSSDMRDHERVHTGERPYHCGVCGKGFTQSSVLSGHARIHTGERPFRCALCGRAFNNSSNFRKHQRTHLPGPRGAGHPEGRP
ncbi:zinc finger protein 784 [Thomomys bottae]